MSIALDLTKKFELNLEKAGFTFIPTMPTKLRVDKSGSMDEEFANGWVQKTIDLFIGAAMKFDDDGELDMGFFDTHAHLTEAATADDAGSYLRTKGRSIYASNGTNYAPIIESCETPVKKVEKKGIFGKLFGNKDEAVTTAAVRQYVGVITDGDAADNRTFEQRLAETDGNTFYQFIAIGNQVNLTYMKKVASQYKHVEFKHIPDPHRMTDDSFYELLCNDKFKAWIG